MNGAQVSALTCLAEAAIRRYPRRRRAYDDREHSGKERAIVGVRDLQRERNRVLTAQAAWQLFVEYGYDNVTVADICAAAEIAPRTFHRYFPSKEDVVTEPMRRMVAIVADHITEAPDATGETELVLSAMRELGAFVVAHTKWVRALHTVIEQSDQLHAVHPVVPPDQEQDLFALLAARDPGTVQPDWRRRLLLAYATAAFRIWYDEYLRGVAADPLAQLDEMLTTVAAAR
jgi:AcrR family transcriptional regulator